MSIKAIIFDAGGVLHSSENEHMHEDIKRTLKISDRQFEKHYPQLVELPVIGKITEDEFWNQFLALTGSTASLPNESLFKREYRKRFKVHADVLDLVKRLKEKGYQLAVLSDTIPSHYQVNQEKGLYNSFPIQTFSFQVGIKKPAAEIYELTLKKLGVEPQEAVFIDDKSEYVVGAEKVGIKGVQFKNFKQLTDELKKLGIL
jgi:epoxide hydrolase-like predicted phosphatase